MKIVLRASGINWLMHMRTFVNHLYASLKNVGVNAFMNSHDINRLLGGWDQFDYLVIPTSTIGLNKLIQQPIQTTNCRSNNLTSKPLLKHYQCIENNLNLHKFYEMYKIYKNYNYMNGILWHPQHPQQQ